eukprot:TRINITY_DN2129_c0_g1_i2.p1 TRINITY_DN2129_c0_g1~~TRINITY_DN2129_c0_g1_i2.p1  ORF type:complete len:245 (+),score=47.60 TRINITY_DN2129_c0_g1_i2:625-1359(+)
MPCTAKKKERRRRQLIRADGSTDVDLVLTTKEFAQLLAHRKINWNAVEESAFDEPLGQSTGAAAIFGVAGGVLEATLRTMRHQAGEEPQQLGFTRRTACGMPYASVQLHGLTESGPRRSFTVNVAGIHGLGSAGRFLATAAASKACSDPPLHLVEVMSCVGGCVGGGGQPTRGVGADVVHARAAAIAGVDHTAVWRLSCCCPAVHRLYNNFLGATRSPLALQLLHTSYGTTTHITLGSTNTVKK